MGEFGISSKIPTIRESNTVQTSKADMSNFVKETDTKQAANSELDTKDKTSFQNVQQSKSYDPEKSNVKFPDKVEQGKEEEKQRVNMFTPLIASILYMLSGTDSPETASVIQKQLSQNAQFISQHGASYNMSVTGGAEAPDNTESERFKKMAENKDEIN